MVASRLVDVGGRRRAGRSRGGRYGKGGCCTTLVCSVRCMAAHKPVTSSNGVEASRGGLRRRRKGLLGDCAARCIVLAPRTVQQDAVYLTKERLPSPRRLSDPRTAPDLLSLVLLIRTQLNCRLSTCYEFTEGVLACPACPGHALRLASSTPTGDSRELPCVLVLRSP